MNYSHKNNGGMINWTKLKKVLTEYITVATATVAVSNILAGGSFEELRNQAKIIQLLINQKVKS